MSRITDLSADGKMKLLQGMYAEAYLCFNEVIGEEIQIMNSFNGRGTCKFALGDIEGAESDFLIAKTMMDPRGFLCANGSIEPRVREKGYHYIELAASIMRALSIIYIMKKDFKKAEQGLIDSSILYESLDCFVKIEENNALLKDIPKEYRTK